MATKAVSDPQACNPEPAEPYQPTIEDVVRVKTILFSYNLPVELLDMILDAAEYWPHSTQVTRFDQTPSGRLVVYASSNNENQLLLRCLPLGFLALPGSPSRPGDYLFGELPLSKRRPLKHEYSPEDFRPYTGSHAGRRLDRPCRKIVFTIVSHDQGWSSHASWNANPYAESYTWFEVGLERFEKGDSCTDGCKDSSPDPGRPLSRDSQGKLSDRSRTEDRAEKPGGRGRDAAGLSLSLCHLRPVIPELRPCSTREKEQLHVDEHEEAYKYEFELLPNERRKVQANKCAQRAMSTFRVEWRAVDSIAKGSPKVESELVMNGRGAATGDGEFVRNLKLGDVVTVWGKARFPGWENHIHEVKVDVYWAI